MHNYWTPLASQLEELDDPPPPLNHLLSIQQTPPQRRATFTLSPHHIDKDSTVWRRGCPPNERTTHRIDPLMAHLPSPTITPLPGHPHPSHGILATSTSGVACSVYYIYGAAQAVALAARASGTPFDPRSLDLPSIGALVGFYHACLGFPVKQTWLDAIKAGNCPRRLLGH